LYIVEADIVQE